MTVPGIEMVDPRTLLQYEGNPRTGDVDAIKESLRVNGMYRPIVVNVGTHTGRGNEILVGNHTARALAELRDEYPSDERWHSIPAWRMDVDDQAAARIVLVDNKLNEAGSIDEILVGQMFADLGIGEGTGYTVAEIEELRELAAAEEIPEVEEDEVPEVEPDPDPVVTPPADTAPADTPVKPKEDTSTVAVTYRDDPEDTPEKETADDEDPDDEPDPFAIDLDDEDRELVRSALIEEGLTAADVLHSWALDLNLADNVADN